MAEIWNKTKYGFDPSHARKIMDFLKSRGLRDNRCGSGRESAGNEEFEDSEEERRAVEGGDDDGESDAEDMEVRREVERARGKLRKEKAVDEDSTPDEDADDDDDDEGADLGASVDGGLMGDGRRGQEGAARAMKEAAGLKKRKRKAKMTTTKARSAPSEPKKSRVLRLTSMLETFRSSVATRILGLRPAVVETAEAVVERWKDVFDKFGVDKVNAICTDSASAYVAASKLLAQEEVKYSRITWLSCAVHECNLLLSDIAKDGRDGSLGKREDTIIRARAVVRFIREHGASLSPPLFRLRGGWWFELCATLVSAARQGACVPCADEVCHPLLDAGEAAGSSQSVGGVDDERRLAADCMKEVHFSAGQMGASSGAVRAILGARGGHRGAHDACDAVATASGQGGVARASLNRTSKDELRIVVQACLARVAHLLEPSHCMAHLLNPRQRSITFFGAARRTHHERILADESLRYLRQQTGGDEDLYQTLRTQLAEFHSREGDWTYGGAEGDRDATACKGEKETSQVKRRNQLGFIKLTHLVEISTNLGLSRCHGRGSGYVLPWEDAEEETEDAIPPPPDEGVRSADRVTKAQRDRQVQRGRKDRLSKAPPNFATYFGRRATVLMAHELESVYDPEPDPMAQDAMEAEPWSDPDDLPVESEPVGSDDDDDDTPLFQIPRPRTRTSTAATAPCPAARPPSSAPDVSQPGPADRVESSTPHPSTDRRGQGGSGERVDEGDDDDGDDREGYEGSNEDEDDPCYSPTCGHGVDDDDEGGDGGRAVGGLRKSERQCGDRCSGAGRGGSGSGVGGAGRTGGAGHAGTRKVRRESASSTRTVHWVDEERSAEASVVAPSPIEVAPSPAELAAAFGEVAPSPLEFAAASVEGPGGFAGGSGNAGEVGRPSAQVGISFSDKIFDVSLGHPPTPAGERVGVDVDAAAMPVSQILRDIPSSSTGDISSSMLQEAAEGALGRSGQHERVAGDDGEYRPVQARATESEQDRIDREERRRAQGLASRYEMTRSVASRARVARMLETGVEAGDAEGECDTAGIGDAGERPASPVQGVCVLPLGGAMPAEELERQAREDPLQADRRGRMTEASRRLRAEAPAYVPCSLSVPSSTTGVSTPAYVEGTIAAEAVRGPSPTPAGESPSPQSRKKKMRAGKNLSTVRRVTPTMRASHPGLGGLHPRTRAILSRDVVADAAGWQERVSDQATDQPMSAPAEAMLPHTAGRTAGTGDHAEHSAPPGRSMASRYCGRV
ncbi:hypothetical protein CBR_g34761 [Chara braunii]|uniref:DUF659 domain-containing protein n=1 Tax=Chara braunii TaxID=69332 RepID=A0A388LJH5_CHABU|nr:hypothetical protein CBR_g34761 [Chara braunii]|eukprot:GBG82385.1 hypothetical protein CBR_g34761 [Chara braunii]